MVSEWRRQAMGAASASVLAPLVLMVAAAAIASGGNFGGLGSLGQVASGPTLPETTLQAQRERSLSRAEIVGADVSRAARPATPAAPSSGGGGGGGGETTTLAQATPAPATTLPRTPRPTPEVTRAAPPTTVPVPAAPELPPVETQEQPGSPNLVQEVLDTTRGLAEGLPGPLGPLAGGLLDLLLGRPAAP